MELSFLKNKGSHTLVFVLLSFLLILNGKNSFIVPVRATSRVHIVYMGERQHKDPKLITELHHQMLASVVGSKEAAIESVIYSYRHGFSGFAAKLTESQAEKISDLPGVVSVVRNQFYSVRTTRSWDYLGLSLTSSNNLLHQTNMGDGIIVGVVDSGIWPESEAFNDKGFGPIPTRWKGHCVSGEHFDAKKSCNKKLIGAKWFADGLLSEGGKLSDFSDYASPRDVGGHGTHTASTAAGSLIRNASFKGIAPGVVRGGAPQARIAMYKAIWGSDELGTTADVLKAFDEAIHDGVDLISASLGNVVPLYADVDLRDLMASGAFHAVAKGIPVIAAGGNEGPNAQTVENTSPWMLTVAATNPDRSFPTRITLGNNMTIHGQSFFVGKKIGFTSLMHPETTDPKNNNLISSSCGSLSFNDAPVDGKVVLCFTHSGYVPSAADAKKAGVVGLIVAKNPDSIIEPPSIDNFPSVIVDFELGTQILFYIRSTKSPVVNISPARTLIGKLAATKVAHFSSRGPSSVSPAILKPDIAAPGVAILAAASALDSTSRNGFAFKSGTSMATPHIAGVVALLKALHPTWSPAAIKSALVTTGLKTDPYGEPIFAGAYPWKLADPFDYGGGLVNPDKAAQPGLIYDMDTNDYIHYLCAMNYNHSSISVLVGRTTPCPKTKPSVLDVNLPSITIPNLKTSVTVTRTVTNVGPSNSVYKSLIEHPMGVFVTVRPEILVFNAITKTISFQVTVTTTHSVNGKYYFGSLTWSDGMHTVASPISVRTQIIESYTDDY